jgi:hypothetical protein
VGAYDSPVDEPLGSGPWGDALAHPDDVVAGAERPGFASRLDRWVADARVDDAAQRRTRERWLRAVAEQEATMAGILLDLAERAATVSLTTTSGRRHRGAIDAIGADFVALRPASGGEILAPLPAVAAVRALAEVDTTIGDRATTTELRLAEVLAELAAERERVLVITRSGDDAVRRRAPQRGARRRGVARRRRSARGRLRAPRRHR